LRLYLIVGGSLVAFWWHCFKRLGSHYGGTVKRRKSLPLIIAVVALLLLRIINGNYWAFAALPHFIAEHSRQYSVRATSVISGYFIISTATFNIFYGYRQGLSTSMILDDKIRG